MAAAMLAGILSISRPSGRIAAVSRIRTAASTKAPTAAAKLGTPERRGDQRRPRRRPGGDDRHAIAHAEEERADSAVARPRPTPTSWSASGVAPTACAAASTIGKRAADARDGRDQRRGRGGDAVPISRVGPLDHRLQQDLAAGADIGLGGVLDLVVADAVLARHEDHRRRRDPRRRSRRRGPRRSRYPCADSPPAPRRGAPPRPAPWRRATAGSTRSARSSPRGDDAWRCRPRPRASRRPSS